MNVRVGRKQRASRSVIAERGSAGWDGCLPESCRELIQSRFQSSLRDGDSAGLRCDWESLFLEDTQMIVMNSQIEDLSLIFPILQIIKLRLREVVTFSKLQSKLVAALGLECSSSCLSSVYCSIFLENM